VLGIDPATNLAKIAELKGIDAGEFPAVPAYLEGEGVTVAIPADVLAWLCKFAAKDGRTANGGCQPLDTLQIEVEDGKASFVASDGVTLALAEYPAQGEVSANFPVFFPNAAPSENIWKPPESVIVGPCHCMNLCSPPASCKIFSPGSR
ncbi:MAG: hypothetical protein UY07_C0010G0014, partial [Parcubacteria group bacterium GW2011_GWA1_47_8]